MGITGIPSPPVFFGVIDVLQQDADTKSYRVPAEERGWYELAIAVIHFAVVDYRRERIRMLKSGVASGKYETIRLFFISSAFYALSGIADGESFLKTLDEDIDKQIHTKLKRPKQIRHF